MQQDACIESEQVNGSREQWIDVDFLDPGLFDHELAETDENLLEGFQIHRLSAADALERCEYLCLLHQSLRQGGVQRRQSQRAIAIDLDHHAARSEEDDGTELRVYAATQNQFVSIAAHHRLHGYPGKMLSTDFFTDGISDRPECSAHLVVCAQAQANAVDIRFVGDRIRKKFEDDGITDLGSNGNRLVFILCGVCRNHWDPIRSQHLLRLEFVEHGPVVAARLLHEFSYLLLGLDRRLRTFN